ncbi:MAG: hypothetical protein LBC96_05145 [Lachnospiraceae bacterium]|jgi:phenylacetate-CoA ligase|nr:hypothetical protein [Lachnospiraceae bacterium]
MKSRLLKKLNTHLPAPIKRVLGTPIRRAFFRHLTFRGQLAELDYLETATNEEKRELQLTKLKQTLIHAYDHTRYYRKLFDKINFDPRTFSAFAEMEQIPLLTRSDIAAHFTELQADDVTDYYLSTSGGSGGAPMKILLSKESLYRERAFIYHYWSQHGYDFHKSKIASFRGGIDFGEDKIKRENPIYREIQLNPCLINEKTVMKYLAHIEQYGAEFLHGYPSALYSFCRFIAAAGIDLRGKFRAVFLISENIYPHQREQIEATLACPIAAFYGHTERAVFAEEAGSGYRFNDSYCYAETNGESIITTGFINRKMPLIRYQTDDSAVSSGYCAKEGVSEIFHITGHRDGVLYGKRGEIMSAASLYVHDDVLDHVANQQFVQDELGRVQMLICPQGSMSEVDRKAINDYYQAKLGSSLDIKVVIVDELHFTPRGKLSLIIQNVKQEE